MIYDEKLRYIKPDKLRFEKFSGIIDNELGTIRTVPENYYVVTVYTFGTIIFEGIEANTRDINKDAVLFWVEQNRAAAGIPEAN
mgnify:CR=1 FL=1